jgi:serine/threonine-protein kinase
MSVETDPRIGTDLAGYRIEALIGRGGMSVVYRAHDVKLGRKVALKLLAPQLAEDERFRERFLRESRIAAAIEHPNIVPVYDADEAEGVLWIAMRYVEGTDLRGLLEREGRLEPARALSFLAQVGSALDAAHAQGLVHRDVKPGNVLLAGEHCYLADFGLTKLVSSVSGITATGQLVGTLDYLAPEQISGNPVDRRADLYSLACLLYECLTGAPPFRRETEAALLWAHVQEPPPALADVRPELAAFDPVLARGLAKSPEERYQSGAELAQAAEEALAGRTPRRPHRARPRLRRPSKRLLLTLAGAALLLIATLVAVLVLSGGEGQAPPPAQAETVHDPATIVPGRSIGAVKLGMSEADVVKALGKPPAKRQWTSRGKTGTTATYTLHSGLFRVSYFDGNVVMISTKSPYYQTAAGIKVGIRVPDPTVPANREQALRTGELLQVGKERYSWRGLLFDGGTSYCSSGNGGVTVLISRGNSEFRLVETSFVPDQPAMAFETATGAPPPCTNAL